jgi:hypothetical protein
MKNKSKTYIYTAPTTTAVEYYICPVVMVSTKAPFESGRLFVSGIGGDENECMWIPKEDCRLFITKEGSEIWLDDQQGKEKGEYK